MLIKVGKTQI